MRELYELNDNEIVNEYYGTIEALRIQFELGHQDCKDVDNYLNDLREEIRKRDLYHLFDTNERRKLEI